MRYILLILVTLALTSCAEMNLGYGLGRGSSYISQNELITVKSGRNSLYKFNSPLRSQGYWNQQYDIRESEVNFNIRKYQFFNITSGWVGLSNKFIISPQKFIEVSPQRSALYTTVEQYKADIAVNWRNTHLDLYLTYLKGKTSRTWVGLSD